MAVINGSKGFAGGWLGTSALALALAFTIALRQAMGAAEPFWSPPTRRVTAAVLPSLAELAPELRLPGQTAPVEELLRELATDEILHRVP